jgi:hypothetical protein
MFNVFARLNQGGLPLSAQEIRNAIYPGEWRAHIRSLAQSEDFLAATGHKVPQDRQQDMEMVLRFAALWAIGHPYKRPPNQVLDKFLNDAVEQRLHMLDDSDWYSIRKAFQKGLSRALKIFGRHAFRKSHGQHVRSPINKGLFESQVVTLAHLSEADIDKLFERRSMLDEKYGKLIDGRTRFSTSLRSGTGHAESSTIRIEELFNLYKEVLNDRTDTSEEL